MAKTWFPTLFGGAPPVRRSGSIDPFLQFQREMNRMFEDAFRGFGVPAAGGATMPLMNVSETDDEFRIEAELPGVSENDVKVELIDDVLTIRGEKKSEREEEDDSYHVMERSYGSFARSIQLPFAVAADQVQASFENGVLTIRLPKSAAQQKARQIPVQAGKPQAGAGRSSVDRAAAGDKPGASADKPSETAD